MSLGRVLAAGVALVCVVLLASCSIVKALPPGPLNDDSDQVAAVEMGHIADAVDHHDLAGLRALFSARAREKATDLDGGLKYFLSVFPSGRLTWKSQGTGLIGDSAYLKQTTELFGHYEVLVDGKKLELSFADFSVNNLDDPDNVGLYALGVVTSAADAYRSTGPRNPFDVWASQFGIVDNQATGDPGVYVPKK